MYTFTCYILQTYALREEALLYSERFCLLAISVLVSKLSGCDKPFSNNPSSRPLLARLSPLTEPLTLWLPVAVLQQNSNFCV